MISSFTQLEERVLSTGKKFRIAVAWAQDDNTLTAIARASEKGFVEGILIGNAAEIANTCKSLSIDDKLFNIIEAQNDIVACNEAVRLTRNGEADIVMKGLVGTDKFLKAVMNRERGIMLPDAILTYVGALEIPAYHKLLFLTDPAVIPFPDLDQKVAMADYAIEMARKFGIEKPRVALIGAVEKMNKHFPNSVDYSVMCKMAERGQIRNCIMDGPLDIFLACDSKSPAIKGVPTPINGDADILLFPSLEASNPFYKGLMLFAGGELAGIIRGTTKPVVVMSRSESERSKYCCIALACLMV
ncbi:MAG TPA: phosphate acyltransferase [Bacteroidales bacterium]|nr:phosphate acyltransferase [Bacteroidales bacterium]